MLAAAGFAAPLSLSLSFSSPSYTHRPWFTRPAAQRRSGAAGRIPRNDFVWGSLEIDSRPPDPSPGSHMPRCLGRAHVRSAYPIAAYPIVDLRALRLRRDEFPHASPGSRPTLYFLWRAGFFGPPRSSSRARPALYVVRPLVRVRGSDRAFASNLCRFLLSRPCPSFEPGRFALPSLSYSLLLPGRGGGLPCSGPRRWRAL